MSFFETNVNRLAQRDAALASALRQSSRGKLDIVQSRSGIPSARANGRWIHSAYDPVREAQAWAESQIHRDGETLVVLGVGLLYQVEALCACLPRTTPVVLVVPDLNILADAASVRAWGDWMDRQYDDTGHVTVVLGSVLLLSIRSQGRIGCPAFSRPRTRRRGTRRPGPRAGPPPRSRPPWRGRSWASRPAPRPPCSSSSGIWALGPLASAASTSGLSR